MALWMTAERVRFLAAAVLLILCLALWKKYGGEGKEKAAAAVFAGFFLGFFVMALETWRFEGEETAWDETTSMFLRRGSLSCSAYFVATATEEGAWLTDFILKGVVTP